MLVSLGTLMFDSTLFLEKEKDYIVKPFPIYISIGKENIVNVEAVRVDFGLQVKLTTIRFEINNMITFSLKFSLGDNAALQKCLGNKSVGVGKYFHF